MDGTVILAMVCEILPPVIWTFAGAFIFLLGFRTARNENIRQLARIVRRIVLKERQ